MIWGDPQELWEAGDLEGAASWLLSRGPPGEQRLLLLEGPGIWGNQIHRILCVLSPVPEKRKALLD